MTNSDHTQHTLGDMLAFAAEMDQYVTALGEQNFYADRRTQLVAEALLHRLGEAVSRLDRDSPSFIQDHPEIEWAKIKAMRNIVAHEYGSSTTEWSGEPCPSLCRRTSKPFGAWWTDAG